MPQKKIKNHAVIVINPLYHDRFATRLAICPRCERKQEIPAESHARDFYCVRCGHGNIKLMESLEFLCKQKLHAFFEIEVNITKLFMVLTNHLSIAREMGNKKLEHFLAEKIVLLDLALHGTQTDLSLVPVKPLARLTSTKDNLK